jgi:hypothetical protein
MSNPSKSLWRVDIIISICAMLISLATFVIYFYQTKLLQSQAKASVYPHLEIIREYNNKNVPFILHIKNVGIGPAFLKKMEIKYKGKVYASDDEGGSDSCLPFKLLMDVLPRDQIPEVGTGPIFPLVIPAGERTMFLVLNENDEKTVQLLVDIFDNCQISVCYSSVYKEYWTVQKWKQPVECENCENVALLKPTVK